MKKNEKKSWWQKKRKKILVEKKFLCCELLLENFRCFSKVRFFCLPPKVPNWIRALKFPSHFTEVLIFFDVAKKIDLFSDVLWGSLLWSLFLRQNLISKVPTARRVVFLSNFECEVIDKCVRGRGVEKKVTPRTYSPPGFPPLPWWSLVLLVDVCLLSIWKDRVVCTEGRSEKAIPLVKGMARRTAPERWFGEIGRPTLLRASRKKKRWPSKALAWLGFFNNTTPGCCGFTLVKSQKWLAQKKKKRLFQILRLALWWC